jgi:hypothetical protein
MCHKKTGYISTGQYEIYHEIQKIKLSIKTILGQFCTTIIFRGANIDGSIWAVNNIRYIRRTKLSQGKTL